MHQPVLLKEVIEYLSPEPTGVFLDATFGGGGHSEKILEKVSPDGRVIAIEKDKLTFDNAKKKFHNVKNLTIVNDDFRNVDKILEGLDVKKIDGALFDLGVSSFQLDEGERGFSYLIEGPIDMRFDKLQEVSAGDVVNSYSQEELETIIRNYGEERHAKLVAKAIIKTRKNKKIETTKELSDLISRSIGSKYYKQKLHPAVRTFQALRIFINDELGAIEEALDKTLLLLNPGARICVISFHSLEDRIVKRKFRKSAKDEMISIITKKPITPEFTEIKENARSRSAKLRVGEKK